MTSPHTLIHVPGKPLGGRPKRDRRDAAYLVRAPGAAPRRHDVSILLQQGDTGACTGNAETYVLSTPEFKPYLPIGTILDETLARRIYSLATRLDDYPGVWNEDGTGEDTGSDGGSAAKAARQLGFITGWRNGSSVDDVKAGLADVAVIVGVPWEEGYDEPDMLADGDVTVSVPNAAPAPSPAPSGLTPFPASVMDWAGRPHVWSKATRAARDVKAWRADNPSVH